MIGNSQSAEDPGGFSRSRGMYNLIHGTVTPELERRRSTIAEGILFNTNDSEWHMTAVHPYEPVFLPYARAFSSSNGQANKHAFPRATGGKPGRTINLWFFSRPSRRPDRGVRWHQDFSLTVPERLASRFYKNHIPHDFVSVFKLGALSPARRHSAPRIHPP